ncbi:MAG: branched-chain amino acid ABC transporter permease [Chloroflexi bacterium]|nr:branched-chain amino acid ABC transporter permease [Chloroflexota bacterium]
MVIFAIAVALGSTWLLSQTGVFEEAGRASPFVVGLLLALMTSATAGFLLGFPVLRLRSDYLAIVTLGFGEIISIALENLESLTGGAFGADGVAKPLPAGSSVAEANLVILYLAIIGSAGIAVLSMRLKSSRLGRSWTALRSDEDIAQAMGVNLVNAKLLAFAIGASFAGAAGLLFASRQANIRPPNFNLNISINVLSLVIIGGMGSIPGVVIGAIALVGLPEMLRALSEYRILVFGALLVAMMLVRPQGLLPKPVAALEERARQLREQGVESMGILSEGADDEQ